MKKTTTPKQLRNLNTSLTTRQPRVLSPSTLRQVQGGIDLGGSYFKEPGKIEIPN